MDNKTCYISVFYLGDRRKEMSESKLDKLFLLKTQIFHLSHYKHNLKEIFLVFNLDKEHECFIPEINDLIPNRIQNTKVTTILRKNIGMSYGAWDEVFQNYKNDFDYYIFNEDDYNFVQDNWDQYLVNKFNFYGDCGYVCPMVKEPMPHSNYKKNTIHSTGISSGKVLNKLLDTYKELPHSKDQNYKGGEASQLIFSHSFIEIGYNLYDIREDYKCAFAMTEPESMDFWKAFYWNKEHLILPTKALHFTKNHIKPHSWYICNDNQYQNHHKPTTLKEALLCKQEKIEIEQLREKPYDKNE